jgi:hypothetical protein
VRWVLLCMRENTSPSSSSFVVRISVSTILVYLAVTWQQTISSGFQPLCHNIVMWTTSEYTPRLTLSHSRRAECIASLAVLCCGWDWGRVFVLGFSLTKHCGCDHVCILVFLHDEHTFTIICNSFLVPPSMCLSCTWISWSVCHMV